MLLALLIIFFPRRTYGALLAYVLSAGLSVLVFILLSIKVFTRFFYRFLDPSAYSVFLFCLAV